MKELFNAVLMSLKVADKTALFILLAADGSINRLGTGTADNSENDLFIGVTKDRLFEQFMSGVDDGIFHHAGRYTLPHPKGQVCTLTISFQVRSDAGGQQNTGFEFIYGSESQGPPREIGEMVVASVNLTQPWFEKQKEMVKNNSEGAA